MASDKKVISLAKDENIVNFQGVIGNTNGPNMIAEANETNNNNNNNSNNNNTSELNLLGESIPNNLIPENLQKVLVDFSIACLINKPADFIDYGVEYFCQVQQNRRSQKKVFLGVKIPSTLSLVKISSKQFGKTEKKKMDTQHQDREDLEAKKVETQAQSYIRRQSVYAMSYDPKEDEDDDDEDEVKDYKNIIEAYPKTPEQREHIKNCIRKVLMFRPIDENEMTEAINAMWDRNVEAGEYIINEEEKDTQGDFYIIENGAFNVYIDGKFAYSYVNNGYFGEMSLMYKTQTNKTIQAITPGMLWVMHGTTFQHILLKSSAKKGRVYEMLLRNVPILKVLNSKEILTLADALIPQFYKKGEQIIKQGDEGNGMYFIVDGQVAVKAEDVKGEGEKYKATRFKGDFFGEVALITKGPRIASIYAETDTKLAFLDKDAFERLLGKCVTLLIERMKMYEDPVLEEFLKEFNLEDED